MILHTVNKSALCNNSLRDCLNLCAQKASVLLIEDGVYSATNSAELRTLVSQHAHIDFYALKADVLARGLLKRLNPDISVIDDAGFVELCVLHHTVQSWY